MFIDDLVIDFVESYSGDFSKWDCNCPKCENGLIESVDLVDYGSTSVPMTTYEVCECVFDSEKLQIHVFVKWLKQDYLDNGLVVPSLFMGN